MGGRLWTPSGFERHGLVSYPKTAIKSASTRGIQIDEDHWTVTQLDRPREGIVASIEDFEEGYRNWRVEGDAFGTAPATGTLPNQQQVAGFSGKHLVNTFLGGDVAQGQAASRYFSITHRYIRFLIGGGQDPDRLALQLVVDGKVVRSATGKNSEELDEGEWDVGAYVGKQAYFRIIDLSSRGWGHILVDAIGFADKTIMQ